MKKQNYVICLQKPKYHQPINLLTIFFCYLLIGVSTLLWAQDPESSFKSSALRSDINTGGSLEINSSLKSSLSSELGSSLESSLDSDLNSNLKSDLSSDLGSSLSSPATLQKKPIEPEFNRLMDLLSTDGYCVEVVTDNNRVDPSSLSSTESVFDPRCIKPEPPPPAPP